MFTIESSYYFSLFIQAITLLIFYLTVSSIYYKPQFILLQNAYFIEYVVSIIEFIGYIILGFYIGSKSNITTIRYLDWFITTNMLLVSLSLFSLFNKDGEWLSEIVFLDRDRVEVKFLNKLKEPTKNSNIELAICLVKKSPMDNILQKATELGVSKITPIVSERTEVKELNFERAKKIVIEATEQSNQLIPPKISEPVKFKNFIESLNDKKLLFADIESKAYLNKKNVNQEDKIVLLIGPEGDFSPAERESILKVPDVKSFSISKNILRSDTAVITAISLVNFVYFNS